MMDRHEKYAQRECHRNLEFVSGEQTDPIVKTNVLEGYPDVEEF